MTVAVGKSTMSSSTWPALVGKRKNTLSMCTSMIFPTYSESSGLIHTTDTCTRAECVLPFSNKCWPSLWS